MTRLISQRPQVEIFLLHPDVLNEEVATTALMLLMAVCRELLMNDRYIREAIEGQYAAEPSVDGGWPAGLWAIGQAIAAS